MTTRPPVSSYQLKVQALLILYKLANVRRSKPYDRSWCLRFLLAFLHSQSNGDRSAFDAYWKAATRAHASGETASRARVIEMRREANRICLAVGEQPKQIQDQFWDELTREAYATRGEEVTILR